MPDFTKEARYPVNKARKLCSLSLGNDLGSVQISTQTKQTAEMMSTYIGHKKQGSCPAKTSNISKQNCLRLVTDIPREETQMVVTDEREVVEQSPSLFSSPYRIIRIYHWVNQATNQHHCVPSPSQGLHHDRLHTSHQGHRCPSNSDNAGLAYQCISQITRKESGS